MLKVNMLQGSLKLPIQFLSLFPKPLRLVIEGSTGSGKTLLAQHLAKSFANYTEIWRYFKFSEIYSVIPNAPVYQPTCYLSNDELPLIWQERVNLWSDNADNKSRCILIDEVPCMLRLAPKNLVLEFLRYVEDTSAIVITQDFEAERGLVEHSIKHRFSLIRLGKNAKHYAEFVLGNTMLLEQLESATYPCLFQGKAMDLAQ